MGASSSKVEKEFSGELVGRRKGVQTPLRYQGITDGGKKGKGIILPPGAVKSTPDDWPFIESCLSKLLLFGKLDAGAQKAIAAEMYELRVPAGNILIKEGDRGIAAAELYVVKSGEFEVLEQRQGVNMRVNRKKRGDVFGEAALLFNHARSATVAATQDAVVWALHRSTFRQYIQDKMENEASQIEVFLNNVPLLASLSTEEKQRLAEAFEEVSYPADYMIIQQGQPGDKFYIVTEGEAVVLVDQPEGPPKKVNHLFKADFFGERALLTDEPRGASVEVVKPMRCLVLKRGVFQELLGPLEDLMKREKSSAVTTSRLTQLQVKGASQSAPVEVLIKRPRRGKSGGEGWDVVRARGHLNEVRELKATTELPDTHSPADQLVLVEGAVLGGGAFSRVSRVTEESSGREYALKRMRKTAVVQCPDHVFCEQTITKNIVHPFCIRQYASFQDKYHLYFLFDLMSGGDLMDVLVSEAHVVRVRMGQGPWRRGCFAPKVKMLKGMGEQLARFYAASIVLALEALHDSKIVYRDLKPENVFVDQEGFVKLGDFGFAKILENTRRTYTFCGTPGYVAPENVLAHGYNYSVDWWGLGVLLYVLLTGRQPFSSPKTDDPMVIMRRIVDENWNIKYPPYLSSAAKDLVSRFLERKPARRLGMLSGRAVDVKQHKWFDGLDWEALAARRMEAPRKPHADSAKRIKDLTDTDKKSHRRSKESAEELAECEQVFASF